MECFECLEEFCSASIHSNPSRLPWVIATIFTKLPPCQSQLNIHWTAKIPTKDQIPIPTETTSKSTIVSAVVGQSWEDVSLVEFMYRLCQVRVTVGDSGLCFVLVWRFWALINSLVCWVLSGSFHTPQVRDTSRSGLSDLYFTILPLFSAYFLRQTLVSPWQSPPLVHITCYNHWLFYVTFSKHWTRKQPLAQPKTCKCLSSPSHFSPFNCCLSVVL